VPLTNHQIFRKPNSTEGVSEIIEKNDICVYIADPRETSDPYNSFECGVEKRCSIIIEINARYMSHPEFGSRIFDTNFISTQNDLAGWL
jgi:hypothetical protein